MQAQRLCRDCTAVRGIGIYLLSFLDTAIEGRGWSESHPCQFYSTGKTRYPLHRRLGGTKVRSGLVRKISPKRDSIPPDRPSRSSVAIPSTLPANKQLYVSTYSNSFSRRNLVPSLGINSRVHFCNSSLRLCRFLYLKGA